MNPTALKNFVQKKAQERNLSLRKIATGIDVSHSYLSETLNGKKPISIEVVNRLADFFDVRRTFLYSLVGWIELNEDEALVEHFREFSEKNPEFAEFARMVMEIEDEEERQRILRLMRAAIGK